MAVLLKIAVPGMDESAYQNSRQHIAPILAANKACHSHVAVGEAGGLSVYEIWDSEQDWDEFFTATVMPNMPPGAPKPVPESFPVWASDLSV